MQPRLFALTNGTKMLAPVHVKATGGARNKHYTVALLLCPPGRVYRHGGLEMKVLTGSREDLFTKSPGAVLAPSVWGRLKKQREPRELSIEFWDALLDNPGVKTLHRSLARMQAEDMPYIGDNEDPNTLLDNLEWEQLFNKRGVNAIAGDHDSAVISESSYHTVIDQHGNDITKKMIKLMEKFGMSANEWEEESRTEDFCQALVKTLGEGYKLGPKVWRSYVQPGYFSDAGIKLLGKLLMAPALTREDVMDPAKVDQLAVEAVTRVLQMELAATGLAFEGAGNLLEHYKQDPHALPKEGAPALGAVEFIHESEEPAQV